MAKDGSQKNLVDVPQVKSMGRIEKWGREVNRVCI
jgi:hypothetical protein